MTPPAGDAAACDVISAEAVDLAEKHLRDILSIAIEHTESRAAVVVSDAQCALAVTLTEAYRRCIPNARFIDFDSTSPAAILEIFEPLVAGDLVVLIQSSNFRLGPYRIRVELFKRALKVVEHPHLLRMPGEQALYYLDALAYDPAYFRGVGYALKD